MGGDSPARGGCRKRSLRYPKPGRIGVPSVDHITKSGADAILTWSYRPPGGVTSRVVEQGPRPAGAFDGLPFIPETETRRRGHRLGISTKWSPIQRTATIHTGSGGRQSPVLRRRRSPTDATAVARRRARHRRLPPTANGPIRYDDLPLESSAPKTLHTAQITGRRGAGGSCDRGGHADAYEAAIPGSEVMDRPVAPAATRRNRRSGFTACG